MSKMVAFSTNRTYELHRLNLNFACQGARPMCTTINMYRFLSSVLNYCISICNSKPA